MVDHLIRLMEDGDFVACLHRAERLLLKGDLTLGSTARVNLAICRSRIGLGDPYGAIEAGLLAAKLARDTQDWDTLGRALLNLSAAYMGTYQYDLALQHAYSYLEHLPVYVESRRFEGAIWRSIGLAHGRRLEFARAVDALQRARRWFAQRHIDHSFFITTHDLIHLYLQQRETHRAVSLDPVFPLLADEQAVAVRHPQEPYYQSYLRYDQAMVYYHQQRLGRAMVSAMKALAYRGDYMLNFHGHMLLHRCYLALGKRKEALRHALSARAAALKGRHEEMAFLTAQAIADLIRQDGGHVVRELDAEYRAMGMDLSQYLPPSLLQRTH